MNTLHANEGFDEETARAEVYGLLSSLYYSAPKPELLAQLRIAVTEAPESGTYLETPWEAMIAVLRAMTNEQVTTEYESLFGGVGKPDVYLFGSFYLSGFLNEKPLAKLRETLNQYGLERDPAMSDTEDHIAYVLEVMRYLIAGDDVAIANLTHQKNFFGEHLQPWVMNLCDALISHPKAKFYKTLAEFTKSFMSVELQGFDLLV